KSWRQWVVVINRLSGELPTGSVGRPWYPVEMRQFIEKADTTPHSNPQAGVEPRRGPEEAQPRPGTRPPRRPPPTRAARRADAHAAEAHRAPRGATRRLTGVTGSSRC